MTLANMGKPNPLPWVPRPVADFVAVALQEPHGKAGLERLQRIVESPDMRPAWKALSNATAESDLLVAFIRQATFSLWLSWGQQLLPSSSPAKQRQQARKVAQASHTLLKHLEALGNGHPERGAQRLTTGVHRASLDAAENGQFGRLRRTAMLAHLPQGRYPTEVVRQLEWLHEAASVAAVAPKPSGPTKLGAKNAVRTAYITELAGFMKQHFKKSLFTVVAITTNVMFEEFESPLTADHVRKLVNPPQKIPRKNPQ